MVDCMYSHIYIPLLNICSYLEIPLIIDSIKCFPLSLVNSEETGEIMTIFTKVDLILKSRNYPHFINLYLNILLNIPLF